MSSDSTASGSIASDGELLPVRMLNEFVYCPRLFHLMQVERLWADNVFTAEGQEAHRRVDRSEDLLPDPSPSLGPRRRNNSEPTGDPPPSVSRSVSLSCERLGLTAKLDLVSTDGDEAIPVDTKRGSAPANTERSWEPERVQLMAQGLLLREAGYRCEHGVLYYAGSKTRVDVPFTAELEARTLFYIKEARIASGRTDLPDPLDDSPKCNGCSLSGICLPDETLALRGLEGDGRTQGAPGVRRLYPSRSDALPLYVQEPGAIVGKDANRLAIRRDGVVLAHARTAELDHVVLGGGVSITPHAIHALCEAGIPIVHVSRGNWFYGITAGFGLRNAFDRAAQFDVARRPDRSIAFARAIIKAKCANQRTLLHRNGKPRPERAVRQISALSRKIPHAQDIDELLGLEGAIGALYFAQFSSLLRPRDFDAMWNFNQRNRRPPRDPVNAMLSFGYAMLAKECTVAIAAAGLDPWWGLFHKPRHGRPALALDLMEEFRPLVVDSAVVTAINTGMIRRRDFLTTASACILNSTGRKAMIRAYETRLDQLVSHPLFGYRCSWRSIIRVQARLLARWLRGDVPAYVGMTTR